MGRMVYLTCQCVASSPPRAAFPRSAWPAGGDHQRHLHGRLGHRHERAARARPVAAHQAGGPRL